MATLPTQGGNDGTWGTDLNTWLLTEHNADGSHDSTDFVASLSSQLLMNGGGIMVQENELVYL